MAGRSVRGLSSQIADHGPRLRNLGGLSLLRVDCVGPIRGSSRPPANAPVFPPGDVIMAPTCSAMMSICLRPARAIWRRQRTRWGEPHRPTAGRPSASAPTRCCSCNAAAGRTTASSCTGPWRARAGCDGTPRTSPRTVARRICLYRDPVPTRVRRSELVRCRSGRGYQ